MTNSWQYSADCRANVVGLDLSPAAQILWNVCQCSCSRLVQSIEPKESIARLSFARFSAIVLTLDISTTTGQQTPRSKQQLTVASSWRTFRSQTESLTPFRRHSSAIGKGRQRCLPRNLTSWATIMLMVSLKYLSLPSICGLSRGQKCMMQRKVALVLKGLDTAVNKSADKCLHASMT